MSEPRGGIDLVGHNVYPVDAYKAVPINNVVITPKTPELSWGSE
jgi:hypothetical protein